MKYKVFIVDDHPFTRAGVRAILETNDAIDIIGEAEDGIDAVKQVIKKQPDLVVMDINMPQLSGIEATREILNKFPDIKIIALSIHKGEIFVKKMLEAGAVGYLLKDEAPEELLIAIMKVIEGNIYLSSGVTRAALSASVPNDKLHKITILQSKLQRPPITFDSVVRIKIIHELENNIAKPLSLISAGAGYGKSAAVSQWLEQTDCLYSWVSIDNEHNNFRIFLHYIIAAVDKIFPGLLEKTKELCLASILPSDKEMSDVLMNELFNIDQDFILVLDDFHLISENRIFDLLDGWLRFPPQSIHLCLITRRDPPLNLNFLRVSGRMTEIRMDKLTFSDEEIAELFNQTKHVVLDNQDIDLLISITEGWAIALKLVSMLINSKEELNEVLPSGERGLINVYDYLLTEVLSKQSDQMKRQLLVMSVLDRFCEDLVWELTKSKYDEHIMKLIPWLIKSNLFTIPLDLKGKWFRFHHLFQDFLQIELKKSLNQEEIKEIHAKASLWFERNGFIEESIDHAMKSFNTNQAVEIISKNWEVVSDSDNFLTVDNWLSYIPEPTIQTSINLLFARFYSVFKGHKLSELPSVLGFILESKTQLKTAEKGYLAFINAMLNYYSGEGEKCLAESEKALKLIPEKYTSFRGDARTYWFIGMLMIGKHEQALAAHKRNINKFLKLGDPVQLGRARTNIGFYALFNAELPLLKIATEEMYKTHDLSNFMLGFYRLNLQYIAWFSNDMEGVVKMSEGVISVRYEFTSLLVIDCYVMKALALQELNKCELATNTIKDAIEFAEYTKDPSNLVVALSGRARLKIMQGEIEFAVGWAEKTELSGIAPTMLWCIEVPEITRCRVLIARGRKKDLATALDLLIKYRKFSESVYYKIQTIDIMMLQVRVYKKLMQENKAHDTLKAAFEIAAKGEWIRPFIEQYNEISDLLLKAKEEGIHPDFIDLIFEAIGKRIKLAVKAPEVQESIKIQKTKDGHSTLTRRELEVLKYIAKGLRNQEIADKLFNSEDTIKKHIYHMFQKLHVKNRLSLVAKAKSLGMLSETK